ncbi:MAG: PAS domain-containing protein [Oligoflexia bacterium]|nr:PAS domain-containing protein [Oligoflexia bacterium]
MKKNYILAFLILVTSLCSTGYFFTKNRYDNLQQKLNRQLSTISKLKIVQIDTWMRERNRDVKDIAVDPLYQEYIRAILITPKNKKNKLLLRNWISFLKQKDLKKNITLFSLAGRPVLSAVDDPLLHNVVANQNFQKVLKLDQVVFEDLSSYAMKNNLGSPEVIALNLWAPIHDTNKPNSKIIGMWLIQFDPTVELYPLIKKWPSRYLSEETLLVRREKNDILFLNITHQKNNTDFYFRIPFDPNSKRAIPAVRAILGYEGPIEGPDYRGVDVVGYVAKISGTPWFIVNKVNADEFYKPIHKTIRLLALLLLGVITVATLGFALLWHKRNNDWLHMQLDERKKAESLLITEKENLTVILRSIGDGVIVLDNQGRITIMNKVAEDITGWSLKDAINKPFSEVFKVISESTGEKCECSVDRFLRSEQNIGKANNIYLVARDETIKTIEDTAAPIMDANNKMVGVVDVFRDVTNQRKIEKHLRNNQKLESLGILAGGIAHDFNNILTVLFGYIGFAKESCKNGSAADILTYLDEALSAFFRVKDLTQQLLTFAKGGAPIKSIQSIIPIIQRSTQLMLSGSNVNFLFDPPQDLWSCEIDENQVGQVFDNIILNARQAMPEGGTLKILAENIVIDNAYKNELVPGNYIRILVKDEGIGISKENLSHIFDPFFSTKKEGNGLGLAITYSVVKNHYGLIEIESELGKGSLFSIYFPAFVGNVSDSHSTSHIVPAEKVKINYKVLVMDDEENICKLNAQVLQTVGCVVECVPNGEEAIKIFKNAYEMSDPFQLVFLDLTVPGKHKGGKEAITELRKIDPNIIAIASSGYVDDVIMSNPQQFGFNDVLRKPYLGQELMNVLNKNMKI